MLAASTIVVAPKPEKPEKPGGGKPPKEEENIAEGVESQITDDPYWIRYGPAFYEDNIVWIDNHYSAEDDSLLRFYELPDGPTTNLYDQYTSMNSPDIYGNKIVFKNKPIGGKIYLYDLEEDKMDIITVKDTGPADIYGNRIVYGISYDIWMYDLGSDGSYGGDDDQEYQLTDDEDISYLMPRIYGNRIVCTQDDLTTEEDDWDLVIFDLGLDGLPGGEGENSDSKTVFVKAGRQSAPVIYGDIVVYFDNGDLKGKNPNSDIYMYDIGTEEITRLTNDKDVQSYLDIYGNIIVWTDYRNDNYEIYMYDLGPDGLPNTEDEGEGEYRVTTHEARQTYPKIFENRIVYLDSRSDEGYDIYMFTLAE
jgi:beta propeller repeat protein